MRRDKHQRPTLPPGGARLKTSAMVASIADENHPARMAPFGHALVQLARTEPSVVVAVELDEPAPRDDPHPERVAEQPERPILPSEERALLVRVHELDRFLHARVEAPWGAERLSPRGDGVGPDGHPARSVSE